MQGKNAPFYGWVIASMGTLGHVLQGGLIDCAMSLYASAFEDKFAAQSVGRAFGLQIPLQTPLSAPSAPLAGYISDTTGSYEIDFLSYIGLVAVSCLTLYLLTRQPAEFDG